MKQYQSMTGVRNMLFILLLLSIIELYLLQLQRSHKKWLQILTITHKLCTALWVPPLPNPNHWGKAAPPDQNRVNPNRLHWMLPHVRFNRDHNNPKSDPLHDTCNNFLHPALLAHNPLWLRVNCSGCQPRFKGFQVMKSLPRHWVICFQHRAPFKEKNLQKKIGVGLIYFKM